MRSNHKPVTEGLRFKDKGYIKSLRCKECGAEFSAIKIFSCENCFGPLEVTYDLDSINLRKESFGDRPKTLWRYHELLPVANKKKIVDLNAGFTALRSCKRLAKRLGMKRLYVKDDTVNPTGSFKDRPATVAVSKALELGYKVVGCASTGNLAAATAAHAAKAGLPCYVFIPANTEMNKVLQAATYGARIIAVNGTYDEANRLAAQASYEYEWALVNINIRPYYTEGSKTLVYEICEQLGWRSPDNIIVPMGSGALLCAIQRGMKQFQEIGLINGLETRLIGAQPLGCSPIVKAYKLNLSDVDPLEKPNTIAKSLAIGDPSDGVYAMKAIRESGGAAELSTDQEILDGISLLAKTEGIFAEPAGAVTIAVLKKLLDSGEILRDEEVVCCVTGSGFKSANTILKTVPEPIKIEPSIKELKKIIG